MSQRKDYTGMDKLSSRDAHVVICALEAAREVYQKDRTICVKAGDWRLALVFNDQAHDASELLERLRAEYGF